MSNSRIYIYIYVLNVWFLIIPLPKAYFFCRRTSHQIMVNQKSIISRKQKSLAILQGVFHLGTWTKLKSLQVRTLLKKDIKLTNHTLLTSCSTLISSEPTQRTLSSKIPRPCPKRNFLTFLHNHSTSLLQ